MKNNIPELSLDEYLNKKKQRDQQNTQSKNILIPSLFTLTLTACGGTSNLIPVAAPDSTLTLDEDSNAIPINIAAPTDEDVNESDPASEEEEPLEENEEKENPEDEGTENNEIAPPSQSPEK